MTKKNCLHKANNDFPKVTKKSLIFQDNGGLSDCWIFIFLWCYLFFHKMVQHKISTILLWSRMALSLRVKMMTLFFFISTLYLCYQCSLVSECKKCPLSLQVSVDRKAAWPANPHYTVGSSREGPLSMYSWVMAWSSLLFLLLLVSWSISGVPVDFCRQNVDHLPKWLSCFPQALRWLTTISLKPDQHENNNNCMPVIIMLAKMQ